MLDRLEGELGTRVDEGDCKLVHRATDRCAFVKAHCTDEEAGLFSYLSLYYCHLPHHQPVAFVILALWLAMLFTTIGIAASDFFCINLSTISNILGMSESMAGVTFLAFGNGSPDVFSTFAAMRTHSGSLAVGELIGAAGFITSVVAGSMALIMPFEVPRRAFVRDLGFFTVAASFSMAFLYDGSLHLWECVVMIAFYVFYVCTVVVWHWWLGRRRRSQEQRMAAPAIDANVTRMDGPALEVRAEGVENGTVSAVSEGETTSLLQGHGSNDDFGALERGRRSPHLQPVEYYDEEESRDRWLAELNNNMRISRPPRGERRPTLNPIRPSLVGALEFRAVLSSMQKSKNVRTMSPNHRRFSDDPNFTTAQQQDGASFVSDPELASNVGSDFGGAMDASLSTNRTRAVSTNDASGVHLGADAMNKLPPRLKVLDKPHAAGRGAHLLQRSRSPSPSFSISPPPSTSGSRSSSRAPSHSRTSRASSTDLLAPPAPGYGGGGTSRSKEQSQASTATLAGHQPPDVSARMSPQLLPRISLPHEPGPSHGRAPHSPFPTYTDSPAMMSAQSTPGPPALVLPGPRISVDSYNAGSEEVDDEPIVWWPYSVLPAPGILAGTLFPTLYPWGKKNVWEKLLGVVSAPSVFLLAITLPVVESDAEDDEGASPAEAYLTPGNDVAPPSSVPGLVAARPDNPAHAAADVRTDYFQTVVHHSKPPHPERRPSKAQVSLSVEAEADEPPHAEWNRWLVGIQTVIAPLFVVLVVWANSTPDPEDAGGLLRSCLYSLIASCVALLLLMTTTSATRPPRWRFVLCFLGFVVSVTWISTIANEVVGVLKAFGVILGISDAILGLTIFAVGNSLGDLVANITVARLGLPVMALSACFGGPMLNILLGVGISGLYMTVRNGVHRHEEDPHGGFHYKPYEIEISSTLLISGATLLLTLVGLLVAVPLNGWRMDHKIGWGLMALWTVSTLGNILVEVTGWWVF
ncbi:MAG: hypothetical protein M1832_004097 [Thelocarpon impressellum]|nr:MAG: hypothetical protein M1832_004097 [Thelocarpon impressellum]